MDFFQSERLIFRAYRAPEDDDFLYKCRSSPSNYPNLFIGLLKPLSREKTRMHRAKKEEGLLHVVICKKLTPPWSSPSTNEASHESEKSSSENGEKPDREPEAIGIFGVNGMEIDRAVNRCAEFAIELAPEHQAHGYGPETIRWGLKWAFQMAGMHRVVIRLFEWNTHALRAYEKVGFKLEGRLREGIWRNGRWWDEIVMGMLEDEWRAIAMHDDKVEDLVQ